MVMTEAAATTELVTLVETVLSNVPNGVNPVPFLRSALHGHIHVPAIPSFKAQLYAISGILTAALICFLLGLFFKWRNGQLWLFQSVKLENAYLLVPHYSTSWAVGMTMEMVLLQALVWNTVKFINDKSTVWDFITWKALVWLPGWCSYWCSTWSVYCSHILFLKGMKREPRWRLMGSPTFINTAGVCIPVALCAIVIPFGLKASQHYQNMLREYNNLDSALAAVGAAWTGAPLTAVDFAAGLPLGDAMLLQFDRFRWFLMVTFITYGVFTAFCTTGFIVTASIHIAALGAVLRDQAAGQSRDTPATLQELAIRSRYRSLRRVSAGIMIIGVVLIATSLYIAGDNETVVQSPAATAAALLLGLLAYNLCFAMVCLPIAVVLLFVAVEQGPVQTLGDGINAPAAPISFKEWTPPVSGSPLDAYRMGQTLPSPTWSLNLSDVATFPAPVYTTYEARSTYESRNGSSSIAESSVGKS